MTKNYWFRKLTGNSEVGYDTEIRYFNQPYNEGKGFSIACAQLRDGCSGDSPCEKGYIRGSCYLEQDVKQRDLIEQCCQSQANSDDHGWKTQDDAQVVGQASLNPVV